MSKRYRLEMTEEQLRLMIDAVEDWSRFLSGQCEMSHATSLLDNCRAAQDALATHVRPYIVPELPYRGASYGWSGGDCPNDAQRKAIAMSYMLYREPLHYLVTHNGKDMSWCVYNSETLRCPEQGEIIKIEEIV
ncbi:MAG: hypothetical protein J6X18_11290 [Bacteroidales bacterium]|nr:hypothetical protein [Bacteroidales bacterium]